VGQTHHHSEGDNRQDPEKRGVSNIMEKHFSAASVAGSEKPKFVLIVSGQEKLAFL
jgi:hypothetical protein